MSDELLDAIAPKPDPRFASLKRAPRGDFSEAVLDRALRLRLRVTTGDSQGARHELAQLRKLVTGE